MTEVLASGLNLAPENIRPMRLAVLDDSELDRQRVLRLCEDAGLHFVATEISSLGDLRQALCGMPFDLILIDYLLAGEDGLDAVDILARESPETAMIMVAGEGRVDIAVEAMRRGCSDYVTKTRMTVDTLQKSIATAIERHKTARTIEMERASRRALERAVKTYANSCSTEMRTLLAASLRRVRKLRARVFEGEDAQDLSMLESNIDQLWEALPRFNDQTRDALMQSAAPPLLQKH